MDIHYHDKNYRDSVAKMIRIVVENDIFVSELCDNLVNTVFYIDYNGKYFPNNQWTDFANSVLGMWAHTLLRSKDSADIRFKLYFMDGPFRMDVAKNNKMQLTIDCVNSRKTEVAEFAFECSYYEFLCAMNDALKEFNLILYNNGMHKGRFEPIYEQAIITMQEIQNAIGKY